MCDDKMVWFLFYSVQGIPLSSHCCCVYLFLFFYIRLSLSRTNSIDLMRITQRIESHYSANKIGVNFPWFISMTYQTRMILAHTHTDTHTPRNKNRKKKLYHGNNNNTPEPFRVIGKNWISYRKTHWQSASIETILFTNSYRSQVTSW